MGINAPAAGLLSEVSEDDSRRLERPIAIATCSPYPGLAKADNIRAMVAGDICEQAWVAIRPPARGIRTNGHIRHAVAADRTCDTELPLVRLLPLDLGPRLAAVLRDPKIARKRAGDNEGAVVRAGKRKHPPAHKPRGRERGIADGRAYIPYVHDKRLLRCPGQSLDRSS